MSDESLQKNDIPPKTTAIWECPECGIIMSCLADSCAGCRFTRIALSDSRVRLFTVQIMETVDE